MQTAICRHIAVAAKIAALTLILLAVQGISSGFLPTAGVGGAQPAPSFFAILLTIMLLQVVALAYPVIRSRWHGWLLIGTMFVVYFGAVTAQSQIESWVYLSRRLPGGMLKGLFLMGLVNAAAFSPLLVLILGKARSSGADPGEPATRLQLSGGEWAWKLAAGSLVFAALYYVFGYYVAWKSPEVRSYYGGTDPGTFLAQMRSIIQATPWMLPFQLARGLGWVLLALPVIRMMKGSWWETGLALSLLFAVPAVYLLLPNPLMPDPVRRAHLIETTPYQFLFGWFIAWLLARGSAGR